MKTTVEKRKPNGSLDYLSLALTTFGVGYIPGAPGTYGSLVAVGGYILLGWLFGHWAVGERVLIINTFGFTLYATMLVILVVLSFIGIWAAGHSIPLLGNDDPSEAVVDEVIGQLITFAFIPLLASWWFVLIGFLLFRLFDIWKPYPIYGLQDLPGGLGICADDIVAGVYAGICLAVIYAVSLFIF